MRTGGSLPYARGYPSNTGPGGFIPACTGADNIPQDTPPPPGHINPQDTPPPSPRTHHQPGHTPHSGTTTTSLRTLHHPPQDTPPPTQDRMTDTSKKVTLATTLLRLVKTET